MEEKSYCRTCLATEDLEIIFINQECSDYRSHQLLMVTGVKIFPNDELSQLICNSCNTLVDDSLKLRSKSQETEILLKKLTPRKDKDISLGTQNNSTEDSLINNITSENNEITVNIINKEHIILNTNNKNNHESVKVRKRMKPYETQRTGNKIKTGEIKDTVDDSEEDDSVDSSYAYSNEDTVILDKVDDINEKTDKDIKCKRKRMTKEQIQKYMLLAVQPVPRSGPVRCSLCAVELRERRFFVNHAKTHFEAEYPCETCGKKFRSRSSVRYHRQRVHGAARRLACARCAFRAVDRAALQNHSRAVHTGERPFECAECGDKFRVRATIVQHMRTHFAAYDVQCEKCPALFRSRSELASHRNKVHLMQYTYYCYLCPGSYKAVGTVKNHLVKVHKVPRDQHPPIKFTKARRPSNEEKSKC